MARGGPPAGPQESGPGDDRGAYWPYNDGKGDRDTDADDNNDDMNDLVHIADYKMLMAVRSRLWP